MDIPKFDAIPIGDLIVTKMPNLKKPQPIIPIEELEQLVITKPEDNLNDKENDKTEEGFTFQWCGQTWRVPLEPQHRFRLRSIKEADVADAWKTLSEA